MPFVRWQERTSAVYKASLLDEPSGRSISTPLLMQRTLLMMDIVGDAIGGASLRGGPGLDPGTRVRRRDRIFQGYRQKRPTFTLETALWSLNLSNLVYWDAPDEDPASYGAGDEIIGGRRADSSGSCIGSIGRDGADGQASGRSQGSAQRTRRKHCTTVSSSGIMSEDDLKGLERNGTHVVTQIDDEETDTHVTGLSVGVRTRLLVETQRGLCNVRAKHLSY